MDVNSTGVSAADNLYVKLGASLLIAGLMMGMVRKLGIRVMLITGLVTFVVGMYAADQGA